MDGFEGPILGQLHDKDMLKKLFVVVVEFRIDRSGYGFRTALARKTALFPSSPSFRCIARDDFSRWAPGSWTRLISAFIVGPIGLLFQASAFGSPFGLDVPLA